MPPRRWLLPLVPIYAVAIAAKRWLQDRRWLPQRQLNHPVVSVGSLSAGGAGKTPVVLMLAELLGERGFEVRILTRGYGRSGKSIERVDPTGDPARFGDEPLLLARRASGASIWVGADRYQAGLLSQAGETPDARVIYLLDDGFQHHKLARSIDVLLLTRHDLADTLLPAGDLREPLKAISRADLILLRDDEVEILGRLQSLSQGKLPPAMSIRRRLSLSPGTIVPRRPVIFCGLGRPEGFVEMLRKQGIIPVAESIFRDHHAYTMGDIEGLLQTARTNDADAFVTTEKDAVKLVPAMIERLKTIGPLLVPSLDVEMLDGQAGIETLLGLLKVNDRRST